MTRCCSCVKLPGPTSCANLPRSKPSNNRTPQADDALVAQVRSEMAAMAAHHEQRVGALEARLKWYAENQEMVGAGDRLIAEQVGATG
jgi:hypothetical protein